MSFPTLLHGSTALFQVYCPSKNCGKVADSDLVCVCVCVCAGRGRGGGAVFACPAGFSSLILRYFFTHNKGSGDGPPGPSPRSASEYDVYIAIE